MYLTNQTPTLSLSQKNLNQKSRHCRTFIEEFNPDVRYKLGKENMVMGDIWTHYNTNAKQYLLFNYPKLYLINYINNYLQNLEFIENNYCN